MFTFVVNILKGTVDVRVAFYVHADVIRTGVGKGIDELVRVVDHEVGVDWQFGHFAHESPNLRSKGKIGGKMSIHDVQVDPVHAGFFGFLNLRFKAGKIGIED